MKLPNDTLRNTAVAALLSFPLASGAALAQSESSSGSGSATAEAQSTSEEQTQDSAAGNQQQEDSVVATVGGSEIRNSEVRAFLTMLPPQMRSQPPQMLVPMALEQLILRELIIQEARSENLQQDPEVLALVEGATSAAEDDALVQIWLERETANAATDQAVQQAYDQAAAQSQQALPPIEEVRPQIEQLLRQQAMQEIRAQLSEGADVVLYDPTGRPIPQPSQGGGNSGSASNGQSAGSSADNAGTDSGSDGDTDSQTDGASTTSGN